MAPGGAAACTGTSLVMATATATTTSIPRPPHFLIKYVFSHDHKIIGIQFLFSGLIFFVLGGLLAMAIRWQLAWPWKPMPILSQALWSDPVAGLPDAARVLQQAVHHARDDHDLLRDHPAA